MIKPFHLLLIGVVANVLTLLLYQYAASQPSGTGDTLAFIVIWMPMVWIPAVAIMIILCVIGRKTLFKRNKLKFIIPLIILCTPIPLLCLANIYYAMTH